MRILADENIPGVQALFGDLSRDIRYLPGRSITSGDLTDTDLLLVRSVTRVNADLLNNNTSLRFVGTATIGVDHIDQAALETAGIGFANAPGSNAESVVDYVLTALLALHRDTPEVLAECSAGVIGAGNVGGRAAARLHALGLAVKRHDPPRADAERDSGALEADRMPYVSLEEVLRSDIVCCHAPLTFDGPYPTAGMLTSGLMSDTLPANAIVLNAGRGGVLPADELRRVMSQRPDIRWVLDVWDPEPAIPVDLLANVTIGTGHIAGYALEGKWRGTRMLREAVSGFLQEASPRIPRLESLLPVAAPLRSDVGPGVSAWQVLAEVVRQAYPIGGEDRRFRSAMAGADPAAAFDHYRKTCPQRREFAFRPLQTSDHAAPLLQAAGFRP